MKKGRSKKWGEAIKSLRDEKGVSQEVLATALGIPRPSIAQIEKGARDVSIGELDSLLQIFQISYDDFMNLVKPTSKKQGTKKTSVKFNPDKFRQLLLYILKKCGSKPNVGETVLYKLLYFCDFDYFEVHEKPLTGMAYKRLQYGPVPNQAIYNPIIKRMIEGGEIQRVLKPYAGDTIQTKYITFVDPNIDVFSPKELETIDRVIRRLSDMSARQIEAHVHSDYPWQTHKDGEIIDYGKVFYREGEFAQRDYEAEYMQAGADDVLRDLGPISQTEYNYYQSFKKR